MRKVFVNNKFLSQMSLPDKGTFVLEPHMILSSYARDYFIEHQIKVVEKENMEDTREETPQLNSLLGRNTSEVHQGNSVSKGTDAVAQNSLRSDIRMILRDEYKIPSQAIEIIVDRVLEKLT